MFLTCDAPRGKRLPAERLRRLPALAFDVCPASDHLVNIAGENPLQRLLVIFRPIDYFGDLRAASDIPVERAQAMQKTRGPIFIEAPHHEWRGYSIIPRRARPAATFSLFSDQMLQQL